METTVSDCVVVGFCEVIEALRSSLNETTGEVSVSNAKAILDLALDAVSKHNGTKIESDAIYAYLSTVKLG
ncbi:hypothetical protein [Serratia proteamaculans]|uniref:hypothetical protein n=1 Tax=Serratia proteamaculans TaxID=28151 RepID=UPI003D029D1A